MKRIICLLLSAMMAISCVACGNKAGSDKDGKVELEVVISQYSSYTQKWWETFEMDFEEAYSDIAGN